MTKLNRKLVGTFNYYSLSGMIREVRKLRDHALYVTFKWLNRRSQRKSFTLERYYEVWDRRITQSHIHVNIWYGDKAVYQ